MNITYKLCLIFLFSLIIANNFSYVKPEDEEYPEETLETTSVSKIKTTTEHDEITTEEENEEQEVTEKIKNAVKKISKDTKKKGASIKISQSQQQVAHVNVVEEDSDDSDKSANSKRLELATEKPITESPTFKAKKITPYPIRKIAMPTFKSLFDQMAFEPMSMSMNFLPFGGNNTFPNFEPMKPMQSIKDMMSRFPSLYPNKTTK